jgi:hypothetical protein
MGDYPLAISLVERGLIDLKPLVTQVVEFEHALEAFETTRKGRDENGKVSTCSVIVSEQYGVELIISPLSSASSMLPSRQCRSKITDYRVILSKLIVFQIKC